MNKLLLILREIRVKQWAKNLLVFFPAFFSGSFLEGAIIIRLFLTFLVFCLTVSSVYIINDIRDLKEDQKHPVKKLRPLAAGKLKRTLVLGLMVLFLFLTTLLLLFLKNSNLILILTMYLVLNLLYTLKLKKIAIWDLLFISGMYMLRLYSGSVVSGIVVSGWLFITVLFGSLLLILGKRYSEFKNNKVRKVLDSYSQDFLYMALIITSAVTVTAFVIYSINIGLSHLPTIIIFIFIIFRYLLLLTTTKKGERPEDILLNDAQIVLGAVFFILYSGYLIYLS